MAIRCSQAERPPVKIQDQIRRSGFRNANPSAGQVLDHLILNGNIRRYLRDRLSAELQTNVDASLRFRDRWQLQVDVVIEELHGLLEGGAILNAHYDVVPKGNPENARRGHVSARVEQSAPGYAALVDAQSELLDQLARRIAEDIRAMQLSAP